MDTRQLAAFCAVVELKSFSQAAERLGGTQPALTLQGRLAAAFCAVVEQKSFSQAAERLGVTQPAVSLQVRSLEKRLGRKLLDRSGPRAELPEARAAPNPPGR